MAGIHEVASEAPKPKIPPALPGEMLAQLRSRVARFEELVAGNRQRMVQIETCLTALNHTAAAPISVRQ